MNSIRWRGAAAFAFATLVCVSYTPAAMVSFHADLDGLQMVPPNASPSFGSADASLNDVSGAFSITAASYTDLLGGSLSVLLNEGAPGVNGAFIFALTNDTPGATTGTFSGGGVLTAGQIASMIAGNTYIRVTSQVFPGGELRGQLISVPEPASLALFALGAFGALIVARIRGRK